MGLWLKQDKGRYGVEIGSDKNLTGDLSLLVSLLSLLCKAMTVQKSGRIHIVHTTNGLLLE